jgi:hypothetical protein
MKQCSFFVPWPWHSPLGVLAFVGEAQPLIEFVQFIRLQTKKSAASDPKLKAVIDEIQAGVRTVDERRSLGAWPEWIALAGTAAARTSLIFPSRLSNFGGPNFGFALALTGLPFRSIRPDLEIRLVLTALVGRRINSLAQFVFLHRRHVHQQFSLSAPSGELGAGARRHGEEQSVSRLG